MAILANLERLLDGHRVPYEIHRHRCMTAAELAVGSRAAQRGREDRRAALRRIASCSRSLPATRHLDLGRLRALVG